jgi:MFS family permease
MSGFADLRHCSWGYVNAFGAFQSYYQQTMPDTPASAISWIGSVQIFLSLMLGIFTGRLLDAGYFLPTYIVGSIIQLLGIFLMSISTKYWHLMLTQGILTGLGNGIFFTPTMALVATYFSDRRGLAIGLVTMGNSGGGAIYPVITRQLLPTIGFAWTSRVLGLVNLCFLLLAFMFLKPRLPPRKSGPMVDLSAFRDPVFLAFIAGIFFVMWANYFTFYYVSTSQEVQTNP